MNELVCIRQRFHKSFLCVCCVSEGINGILMCLQNVCRRARLMRLPHFSSCVQGGREGGLVFTHVGRLKYLSYWVQSMCSQGHNYMSENVMQQ